MLFGWRGAQHMRKIGSDVPEKRKQHLIETKEWWPYKANPLCYWGHTAYPADKEGNGRPHYHTAIFRFLKIPLPRQQPNWWVSLTPNYLFPKVFLVTGWQHRIGARWKDTIRAASQGCNRMKVMWYWAGIYLNQDFPLLILNLLYIQSLSWQFTMEGFAGAYVYRIVLWNCGQATWQCHIRSATWRHLFQHILHSTDRCVCHVGTDDSKWRPG